MRVIQPQRGRRFTPGTLSSMVALATALAAGPSWAQTTPPPPVPSFNAPDPTVRSGSVTYDRGVTTAGVDIYTIASPTAVLDFRPSDANGAGTINFQNAGTTAYFRGGVNTPAFTVLNRIVPTDATRPIQFNGSVISELQTGQTPVTGGNVWFYSPGGIVVGATAAFDVGSLFLTAADPSTTSSGGGGSGGGGVVISSTTSFRGGGATGSAVTIQPGASLGATRPGSYIALVAPVIDQGGAVRVNGSAAFVSAESATLTINQGLFDIQVGLGSDGGLTHSGTTTGPASLGGADNQGIYMVAVPKNTAIAMLVGSTGRIGFDDATDISITNGKIILSAGRNVAAGAIVDSLDPVSPIAANVTISSGNFTSDTVVRATTDARIDPVSSTPRFAGDLTLQGGAKAWLGARQSGAVMTIGGNVTVIADDIRTAATAQDRLDAQGGSARAFAGDGGALRIAGNLKVSADAAPGTTPSSSSSTGVRTATGGQASLYAYGGSIDVGGTTSISANAYQQGLSPDGAPSPRLTGGSAQVDIQDASSTILLRGDTSIIADALGSFSPFALPGDARGGTASLFSNVAGGNIEVRGNLTVTANGTGGFNDQFVGGAGTGGSVYVASLGDPVLITGALALQANGRGGNGSTGGAGIGGTVTLAASGGGSMRVIGDVAVTAGAAGGTSYAASGSGGAASGGTGVISAAGGSLTIGGAASIYTNASGGASFTPFGLPGSGGAANGGAARIGSLGGQITVLGSATLSAQAAGGPGMVSGGSATGGLSDITQHAGGFIDIRGDASLMADATGPYFNTNGAGTVTGGSVFVTSDNGRVTIGGAATLSASAFGVTSGFGSALPLKGGYGEISNSGAGAVVIDGNTSITASAIGAGGSSSSGGSGFGGNATAGTATGGTVLISTLNANASGGGVDLRGGLQLTADATGSMADYLTGASDAIGGRADIFSGANLVHVGGDVSMSAQGQGGNGSSQFGFTESPGGNGTGGTLGISTGSGGDIQIDGAVTMNAGGRGGSTYVSQFGGSGAGGSGVGGFGVGGVGAGGDALVFNPGTMRIGGAALLTVQGFGGQVFGAGEGGDGIGGVAKISSTGGLTFGDALSLDAFGSGASAQYTNLVDGGDGIGGTALIETTDSAAMITVAGATGLRAEGNGGNGGAAPGTIGGDGIGGGAPAFGAANAGALVLATAGTIDLNGGVTMNSGGFGGQGASGGNGVGGSNALSAENGRLTVSGPSSIDARGVGGAAISGSPFGFGGGSGGSGTGGGVSIGTIGSSAGVASTGFVQIDLADIDVRGSGGDGANGFDGDGGGGGDGGNGGDGIGGSVSVLGETSSTGLVTGGLTVLAAATGGNGGGGRVGDTGADGGPGENGQDGGAGFRGGAGGDATAGTVTFGSFTDDDQPPTDTATLSYGDITVDAHATAGDGGGGGRGGPGGMGGVGIGGTLEGENGGAGGDGGRGGDGGAGGNGGIATAGQVLFLVRGLVSNTSGASIDLTGAGGNGAPGGTGGTNGAGGPGGEPGPGGTVGAGGMAGQGVSVDGVGGAGGDGTGGSISIQALAGANLTFGGVSVTANTSGGLPANLSSGPYGTAYGGGLAITTLDSDTAFDLFYYTGFAGIPQTATIEAGSGTLTFGTALNLDLPGDLAFQVHHDGLVTGGDILLRGNGSYTSQLPNTTLDDDGQFDITGQFRAFFYNAVDIVPSVRAGFISIQGGDVRTTTLTADGDVDVRGNSILTGNVLAGQNVTMSTGEADGDVTTGTIDATSGTVDLFAGGAIGTGPITAGRSVFLYGLAGVTAGNVTAALVPPDAESGLVQIRSRFGPIAAGNVAGAEISIMQGLAPFDEPHDLAVGNLLAEKITVFGLGDVTTGNITIADRFAGYDPIGGYQSVVNADGALRIGNADVRGNLILRGPGSGGVTTDALNAGGSIAIFSMSDVTIAGARTATGAGDTLFVSDASILGQDDFAVYDRSFVDGEGSPFDVSLLVSNRPARIGGRFASSGPISTGIFYAAANTLALGDVTATGDVGLSGGLVSAGTVASGGLVDIASGSTLTTLGVTGADGVSLNAAGDLAVGAIGSGGGSVDVTTQWGRLTVGNVSAGDSIHLRANGRVRAGTLAAGSLFASGFGTGRVDVRNAGGDLTTGAISGVVISVQQGLAGWGEGGSGAGGSGAGGNVVLGNLSAETATVIGRGNVTVGTVAGTDLYAGYGAGDPLQLVLNAEGDLAAGNVTAQDTVILSARSGGVTAGRVTTPGSALVLAATGVSIGGASTGAGPGDTLFVSDSSVRGSSAFAGYDPAFVRGGTPFDTAILRSVAPVRLAGTFASSGPVSTGFFTASADILALGDVGATGNVALSGGQIGVGNVQTPGSLAVDAERGVQAGTLAAPGGVRVTTPAGAINAGSVTGGTILVEQGTGSNAGAVVLADLSGSGVTVTGLGAVTTGAIRAMATPAGAGQVVVSGVGDVTTGAVGAPGTLILSSRSGAVTSGPLTTPGSAAIFADGDVSIGGASTGAGAGNILFVSNASILGTSPFSGYDRRFQTANGGGFDPAILMTATPRAIGGAFTSSGPISTGVLRAAAASLSFGAIDARQRIELNASGLAAFAGLVDSPVVGITSGDIDIAQGGAIGTVATQTITLTKLGDAQPIVIGGADSDGGSGTGYRLSNVEAQRLHAHTINIAGGAGAMTVRDLTLAGSASGANANLTGSDLNLTAGVVRITGALGLTGAAASDRVSVIATDRIEVVTDMGGGIALRGAGTAAGGALSGVLDLQAPVIGVATDAVLTRLAADPRFAGRNALLGVAAPTPRPEGYIQAGRIDLTTSNVIAIQNSGTSALAAGFAAGAGGMGIRALATAQGGAAPQVVIYGRVQNAAGGFLTNLDTVKGTTFTGTFDPDSFVNGCRINTACTVGTDQPGTIVSTIAALERVLAADPQYVIDIPSLRFQSLFDEDGLLAEPLITEPVAGAGNPSLWDGGGEGKEPNGAEAATGEKGQ